MNLTPLQEKTLELLAASSLKDKFYWTGGTLLSYHYLHHRRSLDLDFFSDQEFAFDEVNRFVQALKEKERLTKVSYHKIFDRHEFLLANGGELRLDFVYYNRERKPINPHRQRVLGVLVDCLEDIAANKVVALFDRNEAKDLFDLYFLLNKSNLDVAQLLAFVQKKFGLSLEESGFWAETFKALPKLSALQPLLPEGTDPKQICREIEDYLKENSHQFLNRALV